MLTPVHIGLLGGHYVNYWVARAKTIVLCTVVKERQLITQFLEKR